MDCNCKKPLPRLVTMPPAVGAGDQNQVSCINSATLHGHFLSRMERSKKLTMHLKHTKDSDPATRLTLSQCQAQRWSWNFQYLPSMGLWGLRENGKSLTKSYAWLPRSIPSTGGTPVPTVTRSTGTSGKTSVTKWYRIGNSVGSHWLQYTQKWEP